MSENKKFTQEEKELLKNAMALVRTHQTSDSQRRSPEHYKEIQKKSVASRLRNKKIRLKAEKKAGKTKTKEAKG